jgi:hypothetical protein
MKSIGSKIFRVLEGLALALFLTVGTCMLIMFIAMLFAKGPGDGEMFIVGMYTMPLYPIIFVAVITASCEPTAGRRLVRIASMVLLGLLLCVIVASWIKNLVFA